MESVGVRVKQIGLDGSIKKIWRKKKCLAKLPALDNEREYFNGMRVIRLCEECVNHMENIYAEGKPLEFFRAVAVKQWCGCPCHDNGNPYNGLAYGPQGVLL